MVTRNQKNGLIFYQSKFLNIPHAMFTRSGGGSHAPYESLNCSYAIGDNPSIVEKNRKRMQKTMDIEILKGITQVHGDSILTVESIDQATDLTRNDAMITNVAGIGLLIQQADCQAILLHDPVQGVIAAIHNGWRGAVTNIIAKTIDRMQQNFSVQATNLLAVISPSLGPCCAEFINYKNELPHDFLSFASMKNHFDFWAISKWQLTRAGVDEKRIDTAMKCTVCDNDFFSYRRSVTQGNGQTGRNGSVIALPRRKERLRSQVLAKKYLQDERTGSSKSQTRGT